MTDKDVAAKDTTFGVFSVGDHRFAVAAAALGQVMPIQIILLDTLTYSTLVLLMGKKVLLD